MKEFLGEIYVAFIHESKGGIFILFWKNPRKIFSSNLFLFFIFIFMIKIHYDSSLHFRRINGTVSNGMYWKIKDKIWRIPKKTFVVFNGILKWISGQFIERISGGILRRMFTETPK